VKDREPAPALVVDAGNTSVKLAHWDGSAFAATWTLPAAEPLPPLRALPSLPAVVACVNAALLPSLRAWLAATTGTPPVVLGADLEPAFPHTYRTPKTLGIDRLAAAAAAWEEFLCSVVVVDAGSAVTVDWVDGAGRFRGGAIAPGLARWRSALKQAAPGLEWGRLRPGCPFPGESSADGCDVGLTSSARGQLLGLLDAARGAAGAEAPVVLSGGDAGLVVELVPERRFELRPELVLRGILALARAGRPPRK
jgi:type III pantothenate kinase